jgi:GNAT superfamily N-acetyltransferase
MSDDPRAAVREYADGDGPAVRRLHRRALRAAGTDPDDVPGTDDLDDVESAYFDPGGAFLVAEVDGEVVAMGGLAAEAHTDYATLADGEGELLRIAVDPDHQREGYGDAIVGGLEDAARDRGLDRLVLWTARRQRAATEFYPARGYEQVDTRTEGEYDLLKFAKRLD